jgi:hypothetical protein
MTATGPNAHIGRSARREEARLPKQPGLIYMRRAGQWTTTVPSIPAWIWQV